MADEKKKRLPWWLVACVVILLFLNAVAVFIETVGRRGTIMGRFEWVKAGMTLQELKDTPELEYGIVLDMEDGIVWHVDHAEVHVWCDPKTRLVTSKEITLLEDPPFTWQLRRWAEQAYTAIHGPRR